MADSRSATEVGLDMTPMIDVVFQLIIFFMLVVDMSQQDLADITLPMAEKAAEDETEEGRMVVNVYPDGEIEIRRNKYGTLDDPSVANNLRAYLANEVQKGERDAQGLSERSLLIRADKTTKFKEIQKVLQICAQEGIQIYKVQLAASRPQG